LIFRGEKYPALFQAEFFLPLLVGCPEGVGVTVISQTSLDGLRICEGKCTSAALAFVKYTDSFLTDGHGVIVELLNEGEDTAELRFAIYLFGECPTVFVLEEITCGEHTLFLVAQEGNGNREFGKLLELALCVALLPLLRADGHVVA